MMASPAHAFFCFEVLSSSFVETGNPSLTRMLEQYEKGKPEVALSETDHDAMNGGGNTESAITNDLQHKTQSIPQPQSVSKLQSTNSPGRSATSTPSSSSIRSSTSQTTSSTTTADITNTSTYASKLSVTESYPMFVTWNVISRSGHKSLRGCIGTFQSLPLEEGLRQYALTSAFEDTRFSPIPASILPNLACSLTLLAEFEDCENAMDWSLGTHGIRISFTHRYRKYGATYLPDVAVEQGWTKEETLESLMRKAGWESGAKRSARTSSKPWEDVKDFHVVRYTGLKASASYAEWQEWREGVDLGALKQN